MSSFPGFIQCWRWNPGLCAWSVGTVWTVSILYPKSSICKPWCSSFQVTQWCLSLHSLYTLPSVVIYFRQATQGSALPSLGKTNSFTLFPVRTRLPLQVSLPRCISLLLWQKTDKSGFHPLHSKHTSFSRGKKLYLDTLSICEYVNICVNVLMYVRILIYVHIWLNMCMYI